MTDSDPEFDPTRAPSDSQANLDETRDDTSFTLRETESIGPYRLLQQLGEGGMGTVWMAQQEKPVKRRVALKLIKPGLANKQIIARFEAERQALAMMNHQNIAQVLDAGTTDQGVPYFVMELVKGIPFSEYCDKNKLSIRQRLELFIPVCNAIQHAHQKGILHRDLKPSNVLVAIQDNQPTPKVIDFGLAKAVQHTTRLTDKTMFTEFGKVVGTIQYMSPEQADSGGLDVDTRTDIYSLGVMLYELLAGSTPIEKKTIAEGALLKVLELVREKEPPRPSTRLAESGDSVSSISEQRRIGASRLEQILRGELDWIVMKALEKDRNRRYSTASGFAEDISRFLNDEPVTARPPTLGYRLGKFVKKNRGLVAASTAIAALLIGGIAGTSWFAVKASNQRDVAVNERKRADEETLKARQAGELAKQNEEKAIAALRESDKSAKRSFDVLKVVTDAFKSTDPNAGSDVNMSAKDVLINAQKSLEESELDDEGQSLLRRTLTKSFLGLGEFKTAEDSARIEVETRTRLFGADDSRTNSARGDWASALDGLGRTKEAVKVMTSMMELEKAKPEKGADYSDLVTNLGNLHLKLGDYDEALRILNEAYEAQVKQLGPNHEDVLTTQNSIANVYMAAGKPKEAIQLQEQCLTSIEKKLGSDHPSTIRLKTNLGNFYQQMGEFSKAEVLLKEALQASTKKLGEEHPVTLRSINSYASCLSYLGRTGESLELHKKEYEICVRVFGEAHPDTLLAMNSLAVNYEETNQTEEAVKLLRKTLVGYETVYGAKHPETLRAVNNLGSTLMVDNPEEALLLLKRAAEGREETLGLEDPATIVSRNNLAAMYARLGKHKESLELKVENLDLITKALGPDHPNTMVIMSGVAFGHKSLGNFKESMELYEESLRRHKKVLGLNHPYTLRTFDNLRSVYEAAGESDKYVAVMDEQLKVIRENFPAGSLEIAGVKASMGEGLIKFDKLEHAKTLLQECLSVRTEKAPQVWTTFNTQSVLGSVHMSLEELEKAAPLLNSGFEGLKKAEDKIPESIRKERMKAAIERLIEFSKASQDDKGAKKWEQELKGFDS